MWEVEITRNDYIEKYFESTINKTADGCNLESERAMKATALFFFFKWVVASLWKWGGSEEKKFQGKGVLWILGMC